MKVCGLIFREAGKRLLKGRDYEGLLLHILGAAPEPPSLLELHKGRSESLKWGYLFPPPVMCQHSVLLECFS